MIADKKAADEIRAPTYNELISLVDKLRAHVRVSIENVHLLDGLSNLKEMVGEKEDSEAGKTHREVSGSFRFGERCQPD
jgi:hypothetical protein